MSSTELSKHMGKAKGKGKKANKPQPEEKEDDHDRGARHNLVEEESNEDESWPPRPLELRFFKLELTFCESVHLERNV